MFSSNVSSLPAYALVDSQPDKKHHAGPFGSKNSPNLFSGRSNISTLLDPILLKASKPPYVKVLLNLKLCSIRKHVFCSSSPVFYHQASIFSKRLSYLLLWSMTHPLFHRKQKGPETQGATHFYSVRVSQISVAGQSMCHVDRCTSSWDQAFD